MNRKAISEPSLSLDRERGIAGILTARRSGHVCEIDWNSLLLGKKVLTDQGLTDAGVDAPRNSLESSPGTRTPRFSGVRQDDIPYGFEIPRPQYNGRSGETSYSSRLGGELGKKKFGSAPAEVLPIKTLIAQDSCEAEYERKRRSAPSVVARLMGLDTLPDKLSKGSSSTAKPPKPSKSSSSSYGSRRDSKPHSARAEISSRPPSPLHDVDTIKDFPLPRIRGPTDSDVYDDKTKFDVLPFRSHPQERQLQEFKREFMDKLATQRHGHLPSPSDAQLDEKRRLLREKLSEAKESLTSGGAEASRLSSAQEKLLESKEFQDAIELLQTNKEFFKKFFPESNSSSFGNKDPPEPESTGRRSFHLEDLCKEPTKYDDSARRSFHLGDLSRESRKSYFLHDLSIESGRRSFHFDDLSKDSRKSLLHSHGSPKESLGRRSFHLDGSRNSHHVDDVAKEIRALEDYSDSRAGGELTGSTGRGSEHRRRRESKHKPSGVNPVAEELLVIEKSAKVPSMDKEVSSWPTTDHNINGRHGSPNNLDSRKGCDSPSRIVVLKPGPGDITLLSPVIAPNCSPHYRVVLDSREGGFEARGVAPRELAGKLSPPRMEDCIHSKGLRNDYRADPRAIARDIVREARTNSTREISKERETGRESPRSAEASLTRLSGSTGKRGSLPKYAYVMEGSVETVEGSFAIAALSKQPHERSSSPTAPNPSPRMRSQETATTSERSSHHKEGKQQQRRSSEKPRGVYHVEQLHEEERNTNVPSPEVRKPTTQLHEIHRATVSRPRPYLPGNKPHTSKGRPEPFPESQVRQDMYTTLPSTETFLKVETMYSGNRTLNVGDESTPRTLSKSRSVPIAIAVGLKDFSPEIAHRIGNNGSQVQVPDRMESLEHFYLKEKRAEARQAFLLSKRNVTSTSGRSSSNQAYPFVEQTSVQDVHIDTNMGCTLPRSSFEIAIPIESGPRHGVRPCENELLQVLPHLATQLLPKTKDTSEADQFRKMLSHKQIEVPGNKQAAKNSKAWSITTESLESADGDGASETSIDKCGQPSPVSVLDSPFEAEFSSPVEFKEISSDLQDLRLRLRLLKYDGSERSNAVLEGLYVKDKLISPNLHVRRTENSLESTGGIAINAESEPRGPPSQSLQSAVESIDIEGLPCPEGKQEDLLYVINLIAASGLAGNSTTITARWHSPTSPLDPGLYEKLEDYYVGLHPHFSIENDNSKSNMLAHGSQNCCSRRLLFDVVNEVMLHMLGPYLSYRPWIQPLSPLRPIPTQQLVYDIWVEICTGFLPKAAEDFEGLDCLMARDVSRGGPWLDSIEIREQIGLELERIILESLIEEAVQSLGACLP